MRIFVLEDDSMRIEKLQRLLEGNDVTLARTAEEGLKKWAPPYPLLLLDHDLGPEVFMDSEDPGTGYQFLKTIGKGVEGSVVIIHSYNPAGASAMHALAIENKALAVVLAPFGGKAFTSILQQLLPRREKGEEDSDRGVDRSPEGAGAC